MTNKIKTFILLSTLYFLFSITTVQAAGLVPCEGTGCTFCHLLQLVNNVIDFALYKVAAPLVVIMMIYGGLVIMTAGENSGKVDEGKKIIQAAVIGLLIAMGAWLIISQILAIVGGGKFEPWNFFISGENRTIKFSCSQ